MPRKSYDENIYISFVDYYERDRNACRPSFCKECGGKPYLPRPQLPPQPTKYYPDPVSYDQGSHNNEHSDNKPIPPDTRPTTYRPIDKPQYTQDTRPNHPSSVDYHNNGMF